MTKGQLSGIISGIKKRIRSLKLEKSIENNVLEAVFKKKVEVKLVRIPKRVIVLVQELLATSGIAVVSKEGKKWTVDSVGSYISQAPKAGNGRKHFNSNQDNQAIARLMAGVQ